MYKRQEQDPAQPENQFNKPPSKQGNGLSEQSLGLSVLPLTPQIARQLGVPDSTQGVVVNAVDPSSDAGSKGLQRGDIVLSANYRAVTSPVELEAAVREAKGASRNALLLRVQRRGQPATYVPIRIR